MNTFGHIFLHWEYKYPFSYLKSKHFSFFIKKLITSCTHFVNCSGDELYSFTLLLISFNDKDDDCNFDD